MTEVVNQKDLTQAFAARGWLISSKAYGQLRLGDRVLISHLSKRSPSFPFNFSGSVTTDAISIAYTVVLHPNKRTAEDVPLAHSPLFRNNKPVLHDDDIDRACAEWVEWAPQADLAAGMAALLDKDANDKGDMPARHLAALAVSGSVEVLETYNQAFAKGDRLGLANYITADHMAAALAFAQRRRVEPHWLPRSPKLRV